MVVKMQATNDGIWDWNIKEEIIGFSPRYKAMLGYSTEEFVDLMQSKWDNIHPDDSAQETEIINQYLTKEIAEYKNTYRMLHKNGSWHWFMSRAIALWDNDGKPYRMIGSQTDISAQKTLEYELTEARDKAEAANQAKSDFLANISHELRTPMNAVVGISNILVANQTTAARHKELLVTLQLSAQSLMILINDLLDIEKFENGDVKLENISFNLEEMIEEIVSIMSIKTEEKNIELRINYNPIIDTDFIGDPLRLRQILLNLLSNAVKFTHKGHVTICVDCTKKEDNEAILVVNVVDTGIGIALDKQETIFNKFSQADTFITRKYGGTGLGLSICKTLVTLMKGDIAVTSNLNKGSRFTVTIPLKIATPNEPIAEATPEKAVPIEIESNYKPLILLVEDHKPNVLVAGTLLENLGYHYEVVNNGKKALKKLETRHFGIILMDVQMPEMDGLEATRQIRKNEKKNNLPRIPIIAMTAHALSEDRERCLNAGMDDYISKPFNFKDLKNKLEHFSKVCLAVD